MKRKWTWDYDGDKLDMVIGDEVRTDFSAQPRVAVACALLATATTSCGQRVMYCCLKC